MTNEYTPFFVLVCLLWLECRGVGSTWSGEKVGT